MNDIKRKIKRVPVTKKSTKLDLSFLESEKPLAMQEIDQPQHLTYKLGSVFKQRTTKEVIIAVLLFGAGLGLGLLISNSAGNIDIVTAPADVIPATAEPQIAGEQDQRFPPDVYHKLQLVSGDVYYSLITESDDDFYQLTNVFYTIEESSTAGGSPKITLAMYEQAADQPAGELLLSSDQVKTIRQLSPASSIVTAIAQYLTNQRAGVLAEDEISEN